MCVIARPGLSSAMSTVDKSIAQNFRERRICRAANGLGGGRKSLELVMMVAYIHEYIESH